MRSPFFWLCLAAAGCSFKVAGIAPPRASPADLSVGREDAAADLAVADGNPMVVDLQPLPPPPDLALGLVLSHLPQHYLSDGSCALTVATSISTSTPLLIDGAPAPTGCVFTTDMEGGTLEVAVLAVGSLTVGATVRVTGSRPLVVAAADKITITGTLDGGAKTSTPGPGGGIAEQGTGAGKDGSHAGTYTDSGGGGAGFLIAGANGGSASFTGSSATGGVAGAGFTGDLSVSLPGGSSGGKLSAEACSAGMANGGGGAGGGSIQLSARGSIEVSGNVNVGGGGGLGGCVNGSADEGSGGGGGSGGALWIESPTVKLSGGAWANGGAGGGAAEGLVGANGTAGGNGGDGTMSKTAAAGGTTPGMYAGGGGSGGTGTGLSASSGAPPGAPTAAPAGMTANGGGGGGSAGEITIRYNGSAMLSGNISPVPQLDPTVP